MLDALYAEAKFQYDAGSYEHASNLLYYFRLLVSLYF